MPRSIAGATVVLVVVGLLAAAGVGIVAGGPFASGSSSATVTYPSDATIEPDAVESATVMASDVPTPGVCTVTVDITYDPNVKIPTACQPDPDGHFGTTLCNIDIPGTISLTLVEVAKPVSGEFPVANITWQAVGDPGECTDVDVIVHQFADCTGVDMPVIDGDGDNCIATPTPIITPTPTATATPSGTPPVGPTRTLHWGPGWHNATWSVDSTPEEVFACAMGNYAAAYRLVGGGWERYFPDRPELSNMGDLEPYDAFLILVTADVTCEMPLADPLGTERTLDWGVGWQDEGWTGPDGTPPQDAFACANGSYAAAYRLVGGGWERYFPDRPDVSNMGLLNRYDASFILVTVPVRCVMPIVPHGVS
jgi:hypothetical protein